MNVTTKGRYALRVMLDLAQQPMDTIVPLSEIAARQSISPKYLEMIVGVLNKAKMVASTRGKNGGYRLTRTPESYTVQEILTLTEGSLAPVSCVDDGCARAGECLTYPLWKELDGVIETFLKSVTLADLLKEKTEKTLDISNPTAII